MLCKYGIIMAGFEEINRICTGLEVGGIAWLYF
jgi:hypothetical protein